MNLHDRYKKVLDAIAAAAAKAKRNPKEITLIGVTKTASTDAIKQVIELGLRDLGESRVQQLQQRVAQVDEWLTRQQARKTIDALSTPKGKASEKSAEKDLPPPGSIRWHMIGHLQRNKVRPIMHLCH